MIVLTKMDIFPLKAKMIIARDDLKSRISLQANYQFSEAVA